jgi:hypothetical protein
MEALCGVSVLGALALVGLVLLIAFGVYMAEHEEADKRQREIATRYQSAALQAAEMDRATWLTVARYKAKADQAAEILRQAAEVQGKR